MQLPEKTENFARANARKPRFCEMVRLLRNSWFELLFRIGKTSCECGGYELLFQEVQLVERFLNF